MPRVAAAAYALNRRCPLKGSPMLALVAHVVAVVTLWSIVTATRTLSHVQSVTQIRARRTVSDVDRGRVRRPHGAAEAAGRAVADRCARRGRVLHRGRMHQVA